MKQDSELSPPQGPHQNPNTKIFWRFFWGTIVTLLCITIPLSLALMFQENQPIAELPITVIEEMIGEAAQKAKKNIEPNVKQMLDQIYEPVYAGIPAYADFHYSVLGEYTELFGVVFSDLANAIHNRLYKGFDRRFVTAATELDKEYAKAFSAALLLSEEIKTSPNRLLGPITKVILDDAMDRARITMPLATVAATVTGIGAMKATMTVVAKKLAYKISTKASAKLALKAGGRGTGIATGALLCAWSGPFAALCGLAGGAAAWLTVDAVVVNLDEYFNRDDFEIELRNIIKEDRKNKKKILEAALIQKACAMAKNFTLEELADEKNKQPPEAKPLCYTGNGEGKRPETH